MKVVVLSASVFEARDLSRRLGVAVQDTLIIQSLLTARRWAPADGDLVLEMASWPQHPESAAITEELLERCLDLDIRWENEPR
jgi:hypothetical protein